MNGTRFLLLIVVFTFFSCSSKLTDKEFEREVFNEIFLNVVDTTYQDRRLYLSFPKLGMAIYDKNGKWIGRDTTGQSERDADHRLIVEELKKDTLNLVIAIGNGGLIEDSTDLKRYNSHKFLFKHLSELPTSKYDSEYKDWATKYPKFVGVLFFSNIKFDATKENGVLNVSYHCGGKCGLGYRVTIQKIKHKWIIKKIEDTWIS